MRDLCKITACAQEPNDKVKWNATEILIGEEEKNLVWQLIVPTEWDNRMRVYHEVVTLQMNQ